MSKRRIIFIAIAAVLMVVVGFITFLILSPRSSPADSVAYEGKDMQILISYSRPYKKGRLIFGPASEGALQPWGQYWRLGADEATTIEVDRDIEFGGEILKAGKYALYAIPGEKEWTIGVNPEYDRWGYFEPDYEKDEFRLTITPIQLPTDVEQLTLSFEKGDQGEAHLVCRWDRTAWRIPIRPI